MILYCHFFLLFDVTAEQLLVINPHSSQAFKKKKSTGFFNGMYK